LNQLWLCWRWLPLEHYWDAQLCSTKPADLSETLRKSLDQAGLKDVTASQDREKGVVSLGGARCGEQ